MSPARTPERLRNGLVSFFILFGVMAAYALLETARDAIFLQYLPASKLPWAYLGAVVAVSLVALAPLGGATPRRVSMVMLAFAGAVLSAWLLHPRGAMGAYGFYTLVCLTATVVIARVWTLIGALFTVGEARRGFALIAAGGALGGMAGAVLATRIAPAHGPMTLVVVAAVALAIASVGPLLVRLPPATPSQRIAPAPIRRMVRTQYARRIFWLVALATIATTLADFIFKAAVASSTKQAQLGTFFAHYQLAASTVGLIMQVAIAPLVLRRVPANRLALVLPALLGGTAIGSVLVPGLAASLLTKGVDVALRNSIHRTSIEVLFLPLPLEVRSRFKTIIDGVGQRGAQALASLLALGAMAAGASARHLAAGVMAAAAAALIAAFGLHRQYVEAFRDQVLEGKLGPAAAPQLDLASVESLVEMLSSPDDVRVLSALETLAVQGKAKLIPSLLLYHPSARVATRALEILVDGTGRRDFLPLTARLLSHPDSGLRATVGRARAQRMADPDELGRLAEDPRPEVAVAGLVGMFHADLGGPAEWRRLADVARRGARDTQLALLRAIVRLPHASLSRLAFRIAEHDDPQLRVAAAEALQACGDQRSLPLALHLLGVRDVREQARRVFLSAGASGIDFLARALGDPSVELELRRHIPRTLSRFDSEGAAAVLLDGLARVGGDGVIRYKMLRGLGRMRHRNHGLRLDRRVVERLALASLDRAQLLRRWRAGMERSGGAPAELLRRMLARKEEMAVERLFRFLDLLRPGEDMERVFDGLNDPDVGRRASSRELLEFLVPASLKGPVLAFVDSLDQPTPATLDETLSAMRSDHSAAVRALADELIRDRDLAEVQLAS
jgi:AAA family ATP:ADP antiporter